MHKCTAGIQEEGSAEHGHAFDQGGFKNSHFLIPFYIQSFANAPFGARIRILCSLFK